MRLDSGITTIGHGLVTAAPDVAEIILGAEVTTTRATSSLDQANTALGAMRAALLAAGVAERDIHQGQTNTWSDPTSRTVNVRLTLRAVVRDVPGVGEVIRCALDAAGEPGRLDSVSFSVADAGPLVAVAREAAFDDARMHAEQYARLAGGRLGRAVEISEDDSGPAVPVMARGLMAAKAMDSVVTNPGTEEVRARVRVRWELLHTEPL